VLRWSHFLKEFGATAAVGVGIGRKCVSIKINFMAFRCSYFVVEVFGGFVVVCHVPTAHELLSSCWSFPLFWVG
jgi:hypothetical protein